MRGYQFRLSFVPTDGRRRRLRMTESLDTGDVAESSLIIPYFCGNVANDVVLARDVVIA